MPQQLLLQTSAQDGSATEINGRRLADSHEQITAILRSRLGQNHADFLAVPALDAQGGVRWTTGLTGAVQRARDLPADERERLEKTAARLRNDIAGLAAQMKAESPATQMVGQMLERAAQAPTGDWLFSVGGKAVTAMWGFASTAIAAPTAAAAVGGAALAAATPPVGATAPAAVAAAPAGPDVIDVEARPVGSGGGAGAAAGGPGGPGGPRRPWWRWLLWALLIALLLALLLFGLKRCAGMFPGAADASGAMAEVEKQNKELEDEIARRKNGPQFECVPEEPPKPPEPPASEPQPPASEPQPPASKPEPPASKPQPPASKPQPPASKPQPPASKPEPPPSAPKPPPPPPPAPQAKCKPHQPGDEPEVVMIVDASGSMNEKFGAGSRLDAAKRAADAMIRGLPPEVDVGLVDFAACGQVRRDKFYSSGQRGALIGEINGLSPQKGTPLADAIRRAGTVASSSADSVIVIVSDGDDSCGGDPCAAARAIKAAKPNVVINVIDLADTAKDKQVLQCIASAGGGRVLSPGDPLDLARKMKDAVAPATCKQ